MSLIVCISASTTTPNTPANAPATPAMPFGFPFASPPANATQPSTNTNQASSFPSFMPFNPMLMNMLAANNTSNTPTPPAATSSSVDYREVFSSQLTQLGDMGFTDSEKCIEALKQCNGNVMAAIDKLVNQ